MAIWRCIYLKISRGVEKIMNSQNKKITSTTTKKQRFFLWEASITRGLNFLLRGCWYLPKIDTSHLGGWIKALYGGVLQNSGGRFHHHWDVEILTVWPHFAVFEFTSDQKEIHTKTSHARPILFKQHQQKTPQASKNSNKTSPWRAQNSTSDLPPLPSPTENAASTLIDSLKI